MRRLRYMNPFSIFRSSLAQHPINSAISRQYRELQAPSRYGKNAGLDSVESIRIWEEGAADRTRHYSDTNGVEYVESHSKMAVKLIT